MEHKAGLLAAQACCRVFFLCRTEDTKGKMRPGLMAIEMTATAQNTYFPKAVKT